MLKMGLATMRPERRAHHLDLRELPLEIPIAPTRLNVIIHLESYLEYPLVLQLPFAEPQVPIQYLVVLQPAELQQVQTPFENLLELLLMAEQQCEKLRYAALLY